MKYTFSSMLVISMLGAYPAIAEEPPGGVMETVVVTGTRSEGRLALESPVPVDVYDEASLTASGLTDLNRSLQLVSPSVNYARVATGPSGANTRPLTLRGLWPDQTLVLINGKRHHSSSVLNFNNVIGRGSAYVDFGTIPVSAIERIEVLRDGASAQYGSDAIAGVIDIKLRDDGEPGFVSIQTGVTGEGDGANTTLAVTNGFAIGQGSLNLTAELRDRNKTNRGGFDSRFGKVTTEAGDPDSTDINLAAAMRYPVAGAELYMDGIYNDRRSESTPLFRTPSVAPEQYPAGFLPRIEAELDDISTSAGIRGELNGWRWDISNKVGYNKSRFSVSESINTSLGSDSPTRFDSGGAEYLQNVFNVDLSKTLDILAGANIAAGAEQRNERFEIKSGEPLSYAGAGAQGYPGYNPPIPVDESRHARSLYGDFEISLTDMIELSAAVRHEDYSDFGGTTTGKGSIFIKPTETVALRGSISSGFRAPSLIQQSFSTVTSQLSEGNLVNIGTFAVSDPTAVALGAKPLKPEKSNTISAGFILTPTPQLSLTADYFQIEIEDRIALSETLRGPEVEAVLTEAGISNAAEARFFTNALGTTTKGFDITVNWQRGFQWGDATLRLGYGRFETEVDRLAGNEVLPELPLLGDRTLLLLTTGQPKDKLIASTSLQRGPVTLNASVSRIGEAELNTFGFGTQTFDARTIADLIVDYAVADNLVMSVGILNLTDTYPEKTKGRENVLGGSLQYQEYGGLNTNGREFFLRTTLHF